MVFESFLTFVQHGGYLEIFVASFILNATVLIPIIPLPSYLPIIVGVGIGLNPLLTGLIAGVGGSLAKLIPYFAGFGGSAAIEKFEHRTPRFLKILERFYSNIGFLTIMIWSFLPLPSDIICVLSGAAEYDVKKFFTAFLIGRTARSIIIAYIGTFLIEFGQNLLQYIVHLFA